MQLRFEDVFGRPREVAFGFDTDFALQEILFVTMGATAILSCDRTPESVKQRFLEQQEKARRERMDQAARALQQEAREREEKRQELERLREEVRQKEEHICQHEEKLRQREEHLRQKEEHLL